MKKESRYKRLGLCEIQAIFVMRELGKSFQEMGEELGRGKGTVWRVVRGYRHPFPVVWRSMSAYEKARHVFERMEKNKSRRGNRGHLKDAVARGFVCEKLSDGYSPEEISELMRRKLLERRVCAKTIYNFTKKEGQEFRKYLAEKGKKRRQQVTRRRGNRRPAPEKRSIHERTAANNDRLEAGHLECDSIVSKKGGGGALLVMVDRLNRRAWIRLIPNLQASTALGVLRAILWSLPPHLRKSITFDNGSEFAISEMKKLEEWFPGFLVYHCDAYAAWQRGTVENTNRRIRRFFPKGTDFHGTAKEAVAHAESRINQRLMKCLGWRTPEEVWKSYLTPELLLPLAA